MKLRYVLLFMLTSVSCYQLPMIREYNRLPEILHQAEKNKAIKIGTSIIAAHGITDIVAASPQRFVLSYLSGFTLTYISPIDIRYVWLVLASTYHFSKDMIGPFKLIQSICLHEVFIQHPKWVYLYLLCFHIPLHYWRFFRTLGNIKHIPLCILFTWLIYKIPLHKYKSIYLFPVIGHIMVN